MAAQIGALAVELAASTANFQTDPRRCKNAKRIEGTFSAVKGTDTESRATSAAYSASVAAHPARMEWAEVRDVCDVLSWLES